MVTYLLQMIACSGLLYAYYHFFLRNERFHQYNRFYLLFAMGLSLSLPLLKIPVIVEDNYTYPVYSLVNTGETVIASATQKSPDYTTLLYIVYACVAVGMLAALLKAVFQIARIKKAGNTELIKDIEFVRTSHPDAPFSFFKWLFWNERTHLESKEGSHMFKHELYHIRSKHSWDLLFMEIVLSIFWINPFFYVYRKEVKTIQEFLADRYATRDSDVSSYAEILLLRAIGARQPSLINPFFHNQLKRRITMLTSSKKPQYQWLRKLLVLPVAAVITALFGFTYEKEIKQVVAEIPAILEQHSPALEVDFPENKISVASAAPLRKTDTVPTPGKIDGDKKREVSEYYTTGSERYRKLNAVTVVGYAKEEPKQRTLKEGEIKVDVEAAYKGDWRFFLERNLDGQIPTEKGAPAGNYEVLVRFIVNENGMLSNIEPITNEGFGMEEEVIRILKKSPEWAPAINNKDGKNKAVKSYRIQPVNFQVQRKEVKTVENKPENIGMLTPPSSSVYTKETEVFTKVEIDASYPGNWSSFLARNVNVQIPVDKGAGPGTYTTIIQFIVDTEGTVSNIKALTKHGFGMEEEAMKVIQKSGRWNPAVQNKRVVKAYRKQPITFQISGS